jgi:FKBP-type peptidyl-prolyl cis-trans isomerase
MSMLTALAMITTRPFAVAAIIALALPTSSIVAAKPKAPKVKPPVLTCKVTTPEGLSYTIMKPGKGDKPANDARVIVNYSGRLASDGKEFDAGKDVKFRANQLIPGFTQGLLMMQPGAKFRLCIPSKLGYGAAGAGDIPANADLVFEVDLISFTNPPPKPVVPVADRTCTQTSASGLGYTMVTPGSGATATDKDVVLIDYATFDPKTGIIGEKQIWEKIPMGQVTTIFGEALKMMPPGSNYRFCLPPREGAEAGTPDAERVNLIVDMLGVRPAPVAED